MKEKSTTKKLKKEMSVRQAPNAPANVSAPATVDLAEAAAETALAEGNSYNVAAQEKPLTRNVVVSIKSTLNDLCLQKQRGTWSPSAEALRSIFQCVCLTASQTPCNP